MVSRRSCICELKFKTKKQTKYLRFVIKSNYLVLIAENIECMCKYVDGISQNLQSARPY